MQASLALSNLLFSTFGMDGGSLAECGERCAERQELADGQCVLFSFHWDYVS